MPISASEFARIRAELGMTQKAIADLLQVTDATIRRWESQGADETIRLALIGLRVELLMSGQIHDDELVRRVSHALSGLLDI